MLGKCSALRIENPVKATVNPLLLFPPPAVKAYKLGKCTPQHMTYQLRECGLVICRHVTRCSHFVIPDSQDSPATARTRLTCGAAAPRSRDTMESGCRNAGRRASSRRREMVRRSQPSNPRDLPTTHTHTHLEWLSNARVLLCCRDWKSCIRTTAGAVPLCEEIIIIIYMININDDHT